MSRRTSGRGWWMLSTTVTPRPPSAARMPTTAAALVLSRPAGSPRDEGRYRNIRVPCLARGTAQGVNMTGNSLYQVPHAPRAAWKTCARPVPALSPGATWIRLLPKVLPVTASVMVT